MEVFRGHYVSHCFLMTYPNFWPFFTYFIRIIYIMLNNMNFLIFYKIYKYMDNRILSPALLY